MNVRLKRYKKDFEHSYTFGVFPTLELLAHRPGDALKVVIHPKGEGNTGIVKIREICRNNGIPVDVQEKTLQRLGARQNDFTVGVFRKVESGLSGSANHVVLVNPSGMGNLGAIIRTMVGFGFRDLAVIQPAADILHPEVVRASMGALFQLRFARFVDFDAYREAYPRNLYPLMTGGVTPLPETSFEPPFGLVFGPESAGLPEVFHTIGQSIHIPQSAAIDSLNLAVAVGVTLYQATQTGDVCPLTEDSPLPTHG